MRLVEPAFEIGGDLCRTSSHVVDGGTRALNNQLARQSAELNRRLTEVLELHNLQQRQSNELEVAYDEIGALKQTVAALRDAVAQYEVGAAAAEDRIRLLESEKAVLQAQLDSAFEESKALGDRLSIAEATTKRSEENVVTSVKQIEFLNSEFLAASAERFKIVATMQGEQRRQRGALNQQKSILEHRLKEKEALITAQATQIGQLEGLRDELHKRNRLMEALITSEREAAERKTKGVGKDFGVVAVHECT